MDKGGTTTRRDMLKKSAVAGAVVWAVPTLTASPAFAAGSLATDLCDDNDQVDTITYRWQWTGAASNVWDVCDTDGDNQPNNNNAAFTGQAPASGPVTIRADRLAGSNQLLIKLGNLDSADTPTETKVINLNDTFTIVNGPLNPNSRVTMTWAGGTYTMTYHFSCSDPLCFTDQHGAFKVVSYTAS